MSGNQCKVRTNRLPNVEQLWMFPILDNVIGIFVPCISHVINQGAVEVPVRLPAIYTRLPV